MTISGLCVDIQTASGNRNPWSISTSITQSLASCKIPNLSYFLDDVLKEVFHEFCSVKVINSLSRKKSLVVLRFQFQK